MIYEATTRWRAESGRHAMGDPEPVEGCETVRDWLAMQVANGWAVRDVTGLWRGTVELPHGIVHDAATRYIAVHIEPTWPETVYAVWRDEA